MTLHPAGSTGGMLLFSDKRNRKIIEIKKIGVAAYLQQPLFFPKMILLDVILPYLSDITANFGKE